MSARFDDRVVSFRSAGSCLHRGHAVQVMRLAKANVRPVARVTKARPATA